jgi:peptide/nickel transport system substrate-binding protein
MRRIHAVAGAAVVATLALTACGNSAPAPSTSGTAKGSLAKGGTFTIALPSDPGNLDPSMTPSSVAREMLGLSYDTLLYQKNDGSFVSGLAQKWDATATTASFTLRPGITCSDGSTLSATDVADNINYIANPKNQSPLLGVVVHEGTTAKADDGARQVTVTSPSANGFLLTELSGVYIICRAGLADHKALAHQTLGTGPWNLTTAVANDHYEFAAHKGYTWGPGGATLSGAGVPSAVNVRIIPNVTTTANLLLDGSVNFATVDGPDTARLAALKLPTIDNVDTTGETWFNQAPGHPGADRAVREALTLAVDRDSLGAIATGKNAQPSKGFITLQPNPCGAQDTIAGLLPTYDLSKAQQILDAAGWKVGPNGVRAKDGKPLRIAFRYDAKGLDARTAGVEYLASEWKKLGVQVDLKALPEAQLNDVFFNTGAWDAAWADFTFNLPSQMVAFVSGPVVPKGSNFSAIKNPAYDAAVQAATPKVGTDGCGDWAAADQALVKDYNLIPMFDSVSRSYVRKGQLEAPGLQIWGATLRLRTA